MLLIVLTYTLKSIIRGKAVVANRHGTIIWGFKLTLNSFICALVVVPVTVSALTVSPDKTVISRLTAKVGNTSFVSK